jgi:hypothetical protein
VPGGLREARSLLKAKLRLHEAKPGSEPRSHAVDQPFDMHNLAREAGVTLSAFTCSFISDAELCCEHISQQAALLWDGATRIHC